MAELCLGTVQFGMKYGIYNTLGKPSEMSCFEMLDTASDAGINYIDTAYAYGDAENLLGKYFEKRKNSENFKIISKLKPNVLRAEDRDTLGIIIKEADGSLMRLGIDCLDGYLLHTPEYVYKDEVLEAMVKLKEKGKVNHIGVSIYEIEDGDYAINSGVIDYIQLPYSILDQRARKTGFLERAKAAGVTIFVRSVFLQGLYMMPFEMIPANLKLVIPYIRIIDNILQKYNVSKIDALLHFVLQEHDVDYLVFGVDTKEQLEMNIASWHKESIPDDLIKQLMNAFGVVERSIIFPSLWSNGKKAE